MPDPHFEDICERVHSEFDQVRVLRGRSAFPADSWRVGRARWDEHKALPALGLLHVGGNSDPSKVEAGVSRYLATASVVGIVAASTAKETERLWWDLLEAVNRTLGPESVSLRYRVLTQENPSVAGHLLAGNEAIEQLFEWKLHLPDPNEILTTRIIIGAQHNCGTIQPDGSILPEPQAQNYLTLFGHQLTLFGHPLSFHGEA